jgi:hemophore
MTSIAWTVRRPAVRRILFGVFATAGAAAAVLTLPSATAATDPCAASEIARAIGTVSTNTGNYLDSHPDTNAALSSAAKQDPQQAVATLKTYFDANPQVGKDMSGLQQPLQTLSGQCKLPISPLQALQLLQGMQQGGGLPGLGALPGGAASPLGAITPGATTPGATSGSAPAATIPGITTAATVPGATALATSPGATTSGGTAPYAAEARASAAPSTTPPSGPTATTR